MSELRKKQNTSSDFDRASIKNGEIKELKIQIDNITKNIETGILDNKIEISCANADVRLIVDQLNIWLHSFKDSIEKLDDDITKLSHCEFNFELQTLQNGPAGKLHHKLFTTISNLNEALKQMYDFNSSITKTSKDISERNSQLSDRTKHQASSLEATKNSMEELALIVEKNSKNALDANTISQEAREQAMNGREAVQKMVDSMSLIKNSATDIQSITEMIKDLAFQTHILSLNAAVEAARAGEQGKSFAIVANEVRSIAGSCTNAIKDINSIITDTTTLINNGENLAKDAELKMGSISESIKKTSDLMHELTSSAQDQDRDIKQSIHEIHTLNSITQENNDLVEVLNTNTDFLDQQTGFMQDAVDVFSIRKSGDFIHPGHMEMQTLSLNTANEIAEMLTWLVQQNHLTESQLFDTQYREIEGTNPKKFTTQFDKTLDKFLPQIQEPILEKYNFIVYAGAVDCNGYFPTHNNKFCQPLTGDYETDLANNRTKRIFSDRVGLTCGRHIEKGKLQIYRRDTGELMFDISAPIYVNDKHWGGFRIGYRLE